MNNRNRHMPEYEPEDRGAVFRPEDLDDILEQLKAGQIGINQAEEPASESPEEAPAASDRAHPHTGQKKSRKNNQTDTEETITEETETKEKKSSSLKDEIISWLQVFITAAVIAFCINTFIIANSQVPTGSMETTIMPGDRVIGSRLSYRFGEPERGDIAIFLYPDDEARGIKTYYVKRIIGMPGDTIDIVNGKVYLNGSETPLDEPYIREAMMLEPPMHYEVPEDCYFMLGDNRNYSNDSRRWTNTFVRRDKLIARVLFQYFPKIRKLQ